ncbi:MAG: PQQ-binding-like beta-propeller repeat protein [bacterium]|nr:PQQ-binding-like beta-propeller repeat protein [bacterium]
MVSRLQAAITLSAALVCSVAAATSYAPRSDVGIVCLDENSGHPIWEHFPDRLGNCQLATDGERLYMIMGLTRMQLMDPLPDLTRWRLVRAIDLLTREHVENPELPDLDELLLGPASRRPLRTAHGDRVVGSPGLHRAVTIMKGDSDEVRWIFSAGNGYWSLLVHNDLVLYAPSGRRNSEETPEPDLVAVSVPRRETVWKLEDGRRIWGFGQGERNLYLCQQEGIRAIDPATGRTVWEQRLPRVRGHAWAAEHNGRVYVVCDYLSILPTYYLYCLDAMTGRIQWTYDPGGAMIRLSLLIHDGKVYTLIAPTRLVRGWPPTGSVDRAGSVWQTAAEAQRDAIRAYFEGKRDAEIELNLRSWHVLGDRSCLGLLKHSSEVLQDDRLRGLSHQLMATFPNSRDARACVAYLRKRLDESPELCAEIRRIIEVYDPVPVWYGLDEIGFPPQPAPKFVLSYSQSALIEEYRALEARAQACVPTELNRRTITDLLRGCGSATFESLLEARRDEPDPVFSALVMAAMLKQHPQRAADWAWQRLDELTDAEIEYLGYFAPPEWLASHLDLLRRCLRSPQPRLQRSAAYRLARLPKSVVVPLCVELLAEYADRNQDDRVPALESAIASVGKHKANEHAGLLKRYLDSEALAVMESPTAYGAEVHHRTYRLRQAAVQALSNMGIQASAETQLPERVLGPEAALQRWRRERDIRRFQGQLSAAQRDGQRDRATGLARQLLALLEQGPIDRYLKQSASREVHSALGQWDKLAGSYPRYGEHWYTRSLVESLADAGRVDDVQAVLDLTDDPEARILGAFALLEAERFAQAFDIVSKHLRGDPNSWEACTGLALILAQRQQYDQADELMDRAMALRPSPWSLPIFCHTVTYWLDRGKPEKANAWIRESMAIDYEQWEQNQLFSWAVQYPQLSDTVNDVLRAHGERARPRQCGTTGTIPLLVALSTLAFARAARRRGPAPQASRRAPK